MTAENPVVEGIHEDDETLGVALPQPANDAHLFTKLAWVSGGIPRVPKRGTHPQGWKFARVEDYADLVRIRLGMVGIICVPIQTTSTREDTRKETRGGDTIYHYTVDIGWFVGHDGEGDLLIQMQGCADDYSDKGHMKAVTANRKNLMLAMLHLASGDDPDAADAFKDSQPAKAKPRPVRQAPPPKPTPPALTSAEIVAAVDGAAPGIDPDERKTLLASAGFHSTGDIAEAGKPGLAKAVEVLSAWHAALSIEAVPHPDETLFKDEIADALDDKIHSMDPDYHEKKGT